MDDHAAKKLSDALLGKTVGGWLIQKYLNHGKSAAVFLGRRDGVDAAVKVFDPEIVQRYGRDKQLKRIEREKSLIGKSHPNLVRIYDGGESDGFLFVVMEYFEGPNLAEALTKIPSSEIRSLIAQIASAAKFLEDLSFAHRDIKPENIGVSLDMRSAKLLDLGVIRPIDLSSITDEGDQKFFIGTLQYSPPELLFREEEPSIEAWRAISFYQLGGVLHDLLMGKPLFQEFTNPYSRMVRAVEREIPSIDAVGADSDLRLLAQNCLAKAPTHRLDTVKWEDFSKPKIADPLEAARRRIAQQKVLATERAPIQPVSSDDLVRAQTYALRTSIESAVVNTIRAESLPRYSTQRMREPNPFLLRVLFEPSVRDGLQFCFALYCQGVVIDPATSLHELRIWACASPVRESVPAEPDPAAPSHAVRGALIDQDIRTHIQQCLVPTYARALDLSFKEEDASVRWLEIEV